ncbi:MAG TPA: RNA pyrophosphohydrolase [Hyphomicrobiaceae bacterium]|nr:RNA pyrophosphohydrolase [Hyphomicrobiaceae bacterium]
MNQSPPRKIEQDQLPLRAGVGIVLVNRAGLVWVGHRRPGWYPSDPAPIWQMPQGGISDGEDPLEAALRELYEETNVQSVEVIGVTDGWLVYEVPTHALGLAMKGRYRGQRQRWFAMRFTGDDAEIDITGTSNGHKAEFQAWRWARADDILSSTVDHKRDVYAAAFNEFSDHLARTIA